jgi:hypothetical protein
MPFSHIKGNESAKAALLNLLQEKKVPHALLFSGSDDTLLNLFALEFAKALLGQNAHARCESGTHPDLYLLRPEGKANLHPVENIRALIEDAAFPPFEAPCRVFIIYDADRMLPASSNALLKTLEEPQPNTYFLLLTKSDSAILLTIRSRCRKVVFFAPSLPKQCPWSAILHEALSGCTYPRLLSILETLENEWSDQESPDLLLEEIFAHHVERHRIAAQEKLSRPNPTLEEVLKRLLTVRTALERHASLRSSLEYAINRF